MVINTKPVVPLNINGRLVLHGAYSILYILHFNHIRLYLAYLTTNVHDFLLRKLKAQVSAYMGKMGKHISFVFS